MGKTRTKIITSSEYAESGITESELRAAQEEAERSTAIEDHHRRRNADPAKWLAAWPLGTLPDEARNRLRGNLLLAYAAALEVDSDPDVQKAHFETEAFNVTPAYETTH